MALKNNWIDKIDKVDDILAEHINSIAHAVMENEENKADKNLSNIDNTTFKQKAEQSGVGGGGSINIDQTYNPTSENAQSGKAIANALINYPKKDEVIPTPTTANVGQTIVVKEIDENGKPTKWEAVDVGGGATEEKWELISSGELTEDVQQYIITKDNNGNKFNLNEVYISLVVKQSTQNTGNKILRLFFNKNYLNECYDFEYAMYTDVDVPCQLYRYHIPNAKNAMAYAMRYGSHSQVKNSTKGSSLVENITSITLFGQAGAIIGAGTTFEIWGRKQ